ncbi:MAG: hypothetical protein H6574_23020 [Lewinellaceae bacterium]|nr:hypothetical protein [Lewinellaceae bacterium]
MTLTGNVTATTLNLTNGLLTTGANSVTVPTAGSITNASASRHVNGNLCRGIASGANTTIIQSVRLRPMRRRVLLSSRYHGGHHVGSTTNGDHPNIASSDVDAVNSVNRYWSFVIQTGLATANYNATFNWVDGTPVDEDAGFDHTTAIVGKYTSSTWTYPTVGTRTTSSIEITGVSGFSDFQVGNGGCEDPDMPTVSASLTAICEEEAAP